MHKNGVCAPSNDHLRLQQPLRVGRYQRHESWPNLEGVELESWEAADFYASLMLGACWGCADLRAPGQLSYFHQTRVCMQTHLEFASALKGQQAVSETKHQDVPQPDWRTPYRDVSNEAK